MPTNNASYFTRWHCETLLFVPSAGTYLNPLVGQLYNAGDYGAAFAKPNGLNRLKTGLVVHRIKGFDLTGDGSVTGQENATHLLASIQIKV